MSWEEALGNETRRGLEVLRSGEPVGSQLVMVRHGSTSDI
jgi:hypothetical protein